MKITKMKIWIDVRNFSKNNISFVQELIEAISSFDDKNTYNIYTSNDFSPESENIKIINSKNYTWFLKEQFNFLKKLNDDKNDVTLFFDETRPIFYNKNCIMVLSNLEKVLYPNLSHTKLFKKYSFLFIFRNNIRKSKIIICFDEKLKANINEDLNIPEEKIKIIKWFFSNNKKSTSKIDVKVKHSIASDYLIYDSLTWANKNIKRLLECLKELNTEKKLSLVFIWREICDDYETRQLVLDLKLEKNCFFVGIPRGDELENYYNNSLWVIYPSLYDTFPNDLSNAVFYETPIIASEKNEIKNIFWNNISYLNPLSINDMKEKIKEFIKKEKKVDYKKIKENYNKNEFITNLLKVINNIKN